nr:MFS transporter [Tomitella biformata]
MAAATVSTFFVNAVAFLIPALHTERGLTLAETGLLAAMPTVGMMLTLVAWGVLIDRIGERKVLVAGLSLTAVAAGLAATVSSIPAVGVLLLLGGMAAASTNSATGRVVVGYFPAHQRGLAMGIRQTAQPIGVALAAMLLPTLSQTANPTQALWLPAVLNLAAAVICLVVIIDPPRPSRTAAADAGLLENPYRQSSHLWRIHAVSALLVVPQFTVWTFALVWLMTDRGWSATAAGLIIVLAQVLGAVGRMVAGWWSDRIGSRMRPIRGIALAAALVMAALAVTDWLGSPVAVALLVAASVITVADNGLAFTAVAEISGSYWSGRALGAQNTGQFLAASIVPPLFGALIGIVGYPATFLISALCPVAAIPLVPKEFSKLSR